ncbi:MAG: DUF3575 domain-containing protein [Muribaculaceae bacterium]|nr:DUF3575 domain-containing protein [Muribaculaceae bacterium]
MRIFAFLFAIITVFTSFGINQADSVKVYFRAGHRQFDPSLGENGMEMDHFIDKVREAAVAGDIEYIEVRAYTSPDGTSKANELLARNRCETISNYIIHQTGVSSDLIRKYPLGIAWDGLRELVKTTPDVPSRDAILNILDNTPVWVFDSHGKIIDGRKSQLMWLDRGNPYKWMIKHLFPQLRNAVAITMVTKGDNAELSEESDKTNKLEVSEESDKTDKLEISEESDKTDKLKLSPEFEKKVKQRFALKTNLLYDVVLMPNLEFEWLIKKNWSVSIEGDVAWWKFSFDRIYRLAMVSPEARYHIRPRDYWHGMYVGLFVGGGLYQLENRHDGYRGEGGMAGLSFGYMWPIGKHFSLEAGVGAGYMHTRYKVYRNEDDHKLYMSTKSLNYFGPLKLKFTIAWRFDIMTKTIKVNSTL